MPTVLERLKQDLANMEKRGRGDGPLAKQLRAQIEASEAFPNSSAEQLYRVAPVQMAPEQELDDDSNQREIVTEEDDLRAGAIRRLKVHHLFKGRQDRTQG